MFLEVRLNPQVGLRINFRLTAWLLIHVLQLLIYAWAVHELWSWNTVANRTAVYEAVVTLAAAWRQTEHPGLVYYPVYGPGFRI